MTRTLRNHLEEKKKGTAKNDPFSATACLSVLLERRPSRVSVFVFCWSARIYDALVNVWLCVLLTETVRTNATKLNQQQKTRLSKFTSKMLPEELRDWTNVLTFIDVGEDSIAECSCPGIGLILNTSYFVRRRTFRIANATTC